jgi:hypothetical protein
MTQPLQDFQKEVKKKRLADFLPGASDEVMKVFRVE